MALSCPAILLKLRYGCRLIRGPRLRFTPRSLISNNWAGGSRSETKHELWNLRTGTAGWAGPVMRSLACLPLHGCPASRGRDRQRRIPPPRGSCALASSTLQRFNGCGTGRQGIHPTALAPPPLLSDGTRCFPAGLMKQPATQPKLLWGLCYLQYVLLPLRPKV